MAWFSHMRRGDFEAAWRTSDAVLQARGKAATRHLPRHEQIVWRGASFAGRRVLVRCYHGLGDTIQFIRYAPRLRAVASRVVVWAQEPLLGLLQTARGIDELLPLHDAAPEVAYDVGVEVMELPYAFRSTLETLPREVPYLDADPVTLPRDERLAVGIVWQAGDWDHRRSVPVEQLAPLATISGVVLHALQRGHELSNWPARFGPVSGRDDVLEAAGVMRSLDLVITVDSMPAHLAGALGVPVWVLLHSEPDWRWMYDRDDSPWYPTMRLFRQRRAGEWGDVIERVASTLRELALRGA